MSNSERMTVGPPYVPESSVGTPINHLRLPLNTAPLGYVFNIGVMYPHVPIMSPRGYPLQLLVARPSMAEIGFIGKALGFRVSGFGFREAEILMADG